MDNESMGTSLKRPLRHFVPPLLKERLFVWLPLRGAVDAVDCRVAFLCFMLYAFATTPSLRTTSPQGEAFCMAPLEGSCRETTEGW